MPYLDVKNARDILWKIKTGQLRKKDVIYQIFDPDKYDRIVYRAYVGKEPALNEILNIYSDMITIERCYENKRRTKIKDLYSDSDDDTLKICTTEEELELEI